MFFQENKLEDCVFPSSSSKAVLGFSNLARLVKTTDTTRTPPHNKPGIYQLKCNTCNLLYIGQTSRNLKTRYNEHVMHIKNNNPQSAYAQHTLNNRHQFGTIDSTMTLLKPLHSQNLLTTHEQLYIHYFHKSGNLIFEQSPGSPNLLFDLTTRPPRPRAIRVSCETIPSMDALPTNRTWPSSCSHGYVL